MKGLRAAARSSVAAWGRPKPLTTRCGACKALSGSGGAAERAQLAWCRPGRPSIAAGCLQGARSSPSPCCRGAWALVVGSRAPCLSAQWRGLEARNGNQKAPGNACSANVGFSTDATAPHAQPFLDGDAPGEPCGLPGRPNWPQDPCSSRSSSTCTRPPHAPHLLHPQPRAQALICRGCLRKAPSETKIPRSGSDQGVQACG